MKTTEEKEHDPKSVDDEKKLNECNVPLMLVSENFSKKEATTNTQSNDLHFVLHIYKEFELRIFKPLLMMKFALFFWHAGATSANAFFPVFLKHRGLTVAHLSLTTAGSVIFQILGSTLSGVIADKIGRSKPILFAHMTIFVTVSFIFMFIPPLTSDSRIPQFQSRNGHDDNAPRSIVEAWCNTSTTFTEQKICKLYYSSNISHISNEERCIPATNIQNKPFPEVIFDVNSTNILEDTKICFYESGTEMSATYTFCNLTYCEFLGRECMSVIENCWIWDSRKILLMSVYALLITAHYLTFRCIFGFFDLTLISLTIEHNANFGRERVFAILGSLVGPLLIGYVLKATSSGSEKNYSLTFVFYILFTILSGLASWNVNIRVKEPGQRMWKKTVTILRKIDVLVFILMLLVSGTSFNMMNIFSNWYLEDLGASKMLLGFVTSLSNVFSIFVLFTSKWWLQNLGEHVIFIVAFLGYAVLGISYSLLTEPWFAVLLGAVTYTFTYHLFWVAAVEYAHSIAPEGLEATVILMAGLLHFAASQASASLIGGMIMDAYGGRIAFRVMGITCLITAMWYTCFLCCKRLFRRK